MVHPILGLGIVNVVLRIVYSEFYAVLSNTRGALVVSIFSVKAVIVVRVKTFAIPLYNTTQRAIYIRGMTIIAAFFILFITTQIQDLLLRRIDSTIKQSAIINWQWVRSSQFNAI